MYGELTAAEVVAEQSRRRKNQAAAGDQLEIVDINTDDKLKPSVEKKTLPPCDRLELTLQELPREMVLQIFATHGVAAQR